ncbi:tropomyosin beta chain-like [Palaemon carinicauda]|uniref:tropomyosin beta chain-like n=1 Tax=Palaemon carinicauda TaxID=392227 RepID=UPI0035B64470
MGDFTKKPAGDFTTNPTGDFTTNPTGDFTTYPTGDLATNPTAFGAMTWCWGDEDSHREAEKFLDLMDREEMERLHPADYDGANYVAGQTKEHAQLEEASKKDLSEEIHQETETANDLQRICEEVHDEEAEEIELSTDNIAISALNADLDRADKKIKGLMARLEKAESQNDELREELSAKTFVQVGEIEAYVEKELENAREEIRILEKKLEKVTEDLETANEKLLEKSDLEEYVENWRFNMG